MVKGGQRNMELARTHIVGAPLESKSADLGNDSPVQWWCAHCEMPLTPQTLQKHTCDKAALERISAERFWRRTARAVHERHASPALQ